MDERDLAKALEEKELRKIAGTAFLHRLKSELPALKGHLTSAIKNPENQAAVAGAVGLTALQYGLNRSGAQEKVTGKAVSKTKDKTFTGDVARLTDQAARISARHPLKSALLTLPAGAKAGKFLAKKLTAK